MADLAVVTGAFSYTGRAIAERLLAEGCRVRTLTRSEHAGDPLAARIESAPLQFSDPVALRESLRGARVLYNTYWIRFERGESTFARAVANTRTLLRAAADASVERVVHVGVTTRPRTRPSRTSAARQSSSGSCAHPACRTRSSARRSSSAGTTSS